MVNRLALVLASLSVLGLIGANTAYQRRAHGAGAAIEKVEWTAAWKAAIPDVRAMSPAADGLVVISGKTVALLAADGAVVRRRDGKEIAVGTTGDLDGDGTDEVVLAREGPEPMIEALDRSLEPRWSIAIVGASRAARLLVADLDGDGRGEVVVGAGATLYALSRTGRPLWKHEILPAGTGEDGLVRGLDDLRLGKGQKARHVAFALQGGTVGVVVGNGGSGWTAKDDRVRRLRTADVDGDGVSELVTGHEGGSVTVWDSKGQALFTTSLGQAVTEIRAVEVDGDRSTPELAIGGKKGAVRAMRGPNAVLAVWVPGKVSAIGGVDLDGDGRDEVFVGTEEGGLSAFGPEGRSMGAVAAGGKVEAIAGVVSPLRERMAVVAAGPAVTAWRLARRHAPAWYRPEAGAFALGLAVIASSWALLGLRPRPVDPGAPEPDGRALHAEALGAARDRIASLMTSGQAREGQAGERLQQIERQLAKAARPRGAASPAPPSSPPPPKREE